jgi:hypothetical protein
MGAVALALSLIALSSRVAAQQQALASDGHGGHRHGHELPMPFAYCRPFLEKMGPADQRQLREAYQEYQAAFSRHMRASRNLEFFVKGPATWIKEDDMRQGWNMTYLFVSCSWSPVAASRRQRPASSSVLRPSSTMCT